jgi:NAD(P)-dependent dehydrogenase (short-subunit alcohol dehydrogenase family)
MASDQNEAARGAVVTGGTSGIGLAIVDRLVRDGYQVYALSRTEHDEFDRTRELAEKLGRPLPVYIQADVANRGQLEAACAEIDVLFPNLSVVVASAGINVREAALDIPEEAVRRMLETNILGVFLTFQVFAPVVLRNQGARFIAIGSVAGKYGMRLRAPYGATKAALSGLVQSLAIEWSPLGATVNAIGPGIIDTPLTRSYVDKFPERAEAVIESTPVGRLGAPEDVSNVAAFLASPESGFITGQTIYVDGGLSVGIASW